MSDAEISKWGDRIVKIKAVECYTYAGVNVGNSADIQRCAAELVSASKGKHVIDFIFNPRIHGQIVVIGFDCVDGAQKFLIAKTAGSARSHCERKRARLRNHFHSGAYVLNGQSEGGDIFLIEQSKITCETRGTFVFDGFGNELRGNAEKKILANFSPKPLIVE